MTPRRPLTPLLLRLHMWLYPRIIVSKSHANTSKYVDTVTIFFKNLNQRSLTPRWPLVPSLLKSRVTLPKDHCVQVPWKYIKVCGYSDFFPKTWTKGHWPLDDLLPQVCWDHMCNPTRGSLCPSLMGIHQCMWIQWSILQNFNQDYHILHTTCTHTTYIDILCTIYVQNEWSHCLFLNKVQARPKDNSPGTWSCIYVTWSWEESQMLLYSFVTVS